MAMQTADIALILARIENEILYSFIANARAFKLLPLLEISKDMHSTQPKIYYDSVLLRFT